MTMRRPPRGDAVPCVYDGRLQREVVVARPFRHQRPDLVDGLVVRAAVQHTLAQRFDRRLTALIAGAGFGKTTALVQAFEENRLRPMGHDVWLACEPADADPHHFAVGLGVALDLAQAPNPDDLVDVVNEWIGGRSPSQVCLVLDDLHLVDGDATPSIVAALLDSMPANGHLVISSRRPPGVPMTRLELIGQCATLGEGELRLTDDDAAGLLGRSTPGDVERFAGWPALIQLARRGRSEQFVIEEVLDLLSSDQLAVLTTLVAVGEADAPLLQELTGLAAGSVLDDVPLVHRRGDRWGAHDLWSDLIEVDDADRTRRRAAEVYLDRAEPERAVDLLVGADARHGAVGDVLGRALRDALLDPNRVPSATVRRWHGQLAGDGFDHPSWDLLDGVAVRLDNPGSERCHERLQRAADGFIDLGDQAAAVAALSALCFAFHVRRDVAGLLTTFGQLQSLADAGVADARPFPLLGAGLVATAQGDPAAVLEQTEQLLALDVSSEIRAITLWLRANALCNLGRPAVEPARECYEMGMPLPGMAMVFCNARLQAGLISEMRDEPVEPVDGERDRFLLATWQCITAGLLGDVDEARRHLAVVESSAASETQWQTVGSVALPQALVAYIERRDDDAATIVRDFIERTPMDGAGHFYYTTSVGLIYPLVPELRAWYHDLDVTDRLGPFQRRDLHLSAAVVQLVEEGELDAARTVELPARVGELMPSLGARNGAVLLAACAAVGRDDADVLSHEFVDLLGERARDEFRLLAADGHAPIAQGARTMLEAIPVAPAESLDVAVLGGTDLRRGGRPVDDADWRRERVRALLTYLVLNPGTTREMAIAALWPDADPTAGRRSLRSTLNMLHAVLEPDRVGGDAPYFVRSIGQHLRLVTDEHLSVDVDRFERHVARATELDEGGTPSRSIEPYLAAVETYRGDLLPDSYDDWVVFARDRLRGRAVGAGVRVAELLMMSGRLDESIDIAVRMLTIEPWSEPAHRVLIAAHLERGDLATAKRCFESCDRALAEIGGAIDDETAELRRRVDAR